MENQFFFPGETGDGETKVLGGGNSKIFYFHPENWGNDPIWRAYFSSGLKPPTRKAFGKITLPKTASSTLKIGRSTQI